VEDAENKRRGKIKVIRTSDHVIICGCSRVTRYIVEGLTQEQAVSKILIVTEKPNPEIPGVIYVNADWTDINILKHLSVDQAVAVVLTAENFDSEREDYNFDIVDMRVLFTLYKIKTTYPQVHTVSELINPEHMPMMKTNLQGDEIILKEIIDGNLIAHCIKIPLVSSLIYELLDLEGKILRETSLEDLDLGDSCLYREVILHGIEHDFTFIGYIRGTENLSQLSPSKNDTILASDRLIYITDR
jgi:voltage-gated potassium channel